LAATRSGPTLCALGPTWPCAQRKPTSRTIVQSNQHSCGAPT
jgi:hypothetical protein